MAQRILLFESDPAFSQQVRENFEALGATVDVATDGAQGLDLATANKPNLILLTIELPGMNGFLVCKKIKKQDNLSDVPLVILSSEATEDVFEQHKKLRTRAEDYIHKPIAFSDLLARVQQFVTIDGNGAGTQGGDDAIEISDLEDDEVILVAEESVPPALPVQAEASDAELFAEEAVEALVAPEEESFAQAESAFTARRGSQQFASASSAADGVYAPPVATPSPAGGQELARIKQDLEQAGARIARLEAELAQTERRATAAEQESQAAKQRAAGAERSLADASKKGGVSSREFLDLREQLNRKDRELLGLRDQVSSRDKQLIEASDRSLTLERQLEDQSDKTLELQRELDKLNETVQALQADKEGAKKRLEDMKSRVERSEQRNRELGEELSGIKHQNQQEIMALAQQHSEALSAVEASHRAALEERNREHAAVLAAMRKAHADESAELRDEHAVALTSLREESEQQKQAALGALRSELEADMQRRAAELQQRYEAQASQALAAHESELTSTRQNLEERHASEMHHANERFQQELGRVGRALAELETKQQLLQDQLEEAESGRADGYARLARVTAERDQKSEQSEELQAQLDHMNAKRVAQEQMLERARKALAIGLALLEEQKRSAQDEKADS